MVTENILPKAAYPYVYANAEIMALQGETEILVLNDDFHLLICAPQYGEIVGGVSGAAFRILAEAGDSLGEYLLFVPESDEPDAEETPAASAGFLS